MLEKNLENPLDGKKIKPVSPKGNQSWIFIERTNAKAPILWAPDAKSWLIGKDPDAGKDWGQEEKGAIRGWDGSIRPPSQWTRVWANSGRQWGTGKPGEPLSMGEVTKSWAWLSDWTTAIKQCLQNVIILDHFVFYWTPKRLLLNFILSVCAEFQWYIFIILKKETMSNQNFE